MRAGPYPGEVEHADPAERTVAVPAVPALPHRRERARRDPRPRTGRRSPPRRARGRTGRAATSGDGGGREARATRYAPPRSGPPGRRSPAPGGAPAPGAARGRTPAPLRPGPPAARGTPPRTFELARPRRHPLPNLGRVLTPGVASDANVSLGPPLPSRPTTRCHPFPLGLLGADDEHLAVAARVETHRLVDGAVAPVVDAPRVFEGGEVTAEEEGDGLLHRHVEVVAEPGHPRFAAGGERGDGRVEPGLDERVVPERADRRPLPRCAPAGDDVAPTAGVHEGKLVPSPAAARAGEAERCDGDHHDPGLAFAPGLRVLELRGTPLPDHDVRPSEQPSSSARPEAVVRSRTTLRLLALRWRKGPPAGALQPGTTPRRRTGSPSGGSTLTTSAPRSASAFPVLDAAKPPPISMTASPSSPFPIATPCRCTKARS